MQSCSVAVPFQHVQYRVHDVSWPKIPYSQSQWSFEIGPSAEYHCVHTHTHKSSWIFKWFVCIFDVISPTHLLSFFHYNNWISMDNRSLRLRHDSCRRTPVHLDNRRVQLDRRHTPNNDRNMLHRRQRGLLFYTDPPAVHDMSLMEVILKIINWILF